MRSGGKQLGIGLVLAGVVGAISLLMQPGPTVRADIRLDEYETSWPDHTDVQNDGAVLLLLATDQIPDVDISIRKDRSTIEIINPADSSLTDIDALIENLVDEDALNRAGATSVEQMTDSLNVLLQELSRLETSDEADSAEASLLAEQAVLLRSELAAQTVSTAATRSRFVALHPASDQIPASLLVQWIIAAGLIAAGGALLLKRAQTQ